MRGDREGRGMKKVQGASFGVRFYRRGISKGAAAMDTPVSKGDVVSDIPEQQNVKAQAQMPVAQQTVFSPAKIAKERMLREAAQSGDCYIIRMLVMDGVDLDARDSMGRTALNIATQYKQAQAIKTLLAAKEMRRMARMGDLPDTAFFRKFAPQAGNGKQ